MFCYQKNFFTPTLPVDREQFYALVRAGQWNEAISEFRRTGDPSLKRRLPAFIFQANFDMTESKNGIAGRWRKQSATRLTGLCVMDIDHVDEPRAAFGGWTAVPAEEGGESRMQALGILLVYVTPSGRGLKVVFKASAARGNLIDNQRYLAERLGVRADEACKDASRMSFICREEDILYIDDELFTYESREYAEKFDEMYRNGKSQATMPTRKPEAKQPEPMPERAGAAPMSERADADAEPLAYKGVAYSRIIAEWWRQSGGEPSEGERNVKLYSLASSLRAICDNSQALLERIMPSCGLGEAELRQIVASACREQPKGISRKMRDVLRALTVSVGESREEKILRSMNEWGAALGQMQQSFPVLKDVFRGLTPRQRPAAFIVAGGLYMTLMTRCHYRFYHRPEEKRRLNCSAFIIGDPASGKSFATRLYKQIAAPIVFADRRGLAAINAYREEMKTKGANKEKPKKPKVMVRVHPSRTSNAQFIQDMVNSVEVVDGEEMQLHMLTFDTELDNTIAISKGGSWIDKNSMELKAFHNEEDGQAYSNADSVMQMFSVTWNYIYTGTPLALRKKVTEANFGSGLATRLCVVPLPPTAFEMMEREQGVDTRSDTRLKEWAWKLDMTKGELPFDPIVDTLYDLTASKMEDAKENDSKADEMLLKRVAYHAINFSAPFIVMRHWEQMRKDGDHFVPDGITLDDIDLALCRFVFNLQYTCQRFFFGELAERYFRNAENEMKAVVGATRKTEMQFEALPDEFTAEDVVRCFSTNAVAARARISRMMRDGVVKLKSRGGGNDNKSIYEKCGVYA